MWIKGDDSFESEAAGILVAETFLMWRAFLKSKFNNPDVKRGSKVK